MAYDQTRYRRTLSRFRRGTFLGPAVSSANAADLHLRFRCRVTRAVEYAWIGNDAGPRDNTIFRLDYLQFFLRMLESRAPYHHAASELRKKNVFPLEILPVSVVASALFHTALSASVLIGALVVTQRLTPFFLYWPLLVLPVCIFTLGITWAISALTVSIKDHRSRSEPDYYVAAISQSNFYPMSSLPAQIQPCITLNPLAFIIEESRAVVLGGRPPNWQSLLVYYAISVAAAVLGLWIFRRLRGGFADVI